MLAAISIELFLASWLEEEISLMAMAEVASQSTEISFLMRTRTSNITKEDFSQWQMLDPTPTDLSSSYALIKLNGMNSSNFIVNYRLDGSHNVFGELLEGEDVLQ